MRRLLIPSVACVAACASFPALAQEKPKSRMQEYLCTFAGKCGDEASEDVPTMAAPETKGFNFRPSTTKSAASEPARPSIASLARPGTVGRQLAPATRQPIATRTASSAAKAPAPRAVQRDEARADLRLTFELNSANLTSAAREDAREFAKALLLPELSGKTFRIEGHTDASGNRALNLDLSQRRARAVADLLASEGVPASRLEVKGYGPDRPLKGRGANSDENRRVEAVLIS
jgi:outer membrane protein OmpA-like peptidoglycan-associated protein